MRALALAAAIAFAGCAHGRTADTYRADTGTVLATKDADLKACYDHVLQTQPAAAGRVTVTFSVAPKTGALQQAAVDAASTTAPEAVSQCVLAALQSLAISPPDRNRGAVTWSWDFQPGAPPAATPKS